MSTLTTTSARPPQKVLVTGLGLVGHLAARIFALCGYEVMACDPSDSRQRIARSAGIGNVAPTVPLQDPEWAGRVALALECSGHEQAALEACRIVRKGGELVLVGVPWLRQTDLSAHELLHAVFHQYAHLRGGWEWELPLQESDFRSNSIYGNIEAAMGWLDAGRITVDGLYTVLPPEECQRAYQSLIGRDSPALTVVFDWLGV